MRTSRNVIKYGELNAIFKGLCHSIYYIFLKNLELFLQHLNSENNGLVLFLTTMFWHWNCWLSLITTDEKLAMD